MNIERCKEMLRAKKFDDLISYLTKCMCELYKEMLEYCGVECQEDWNYIKYGVEVEKRYSSYEDLILVCENAIGSDEYTYAQTIDTLIDAYDEMSKNYKNRLDI